MEAQSHGGRCCGLTHLFNFGQVYAKEIIEALDSLIEEQLEEMKEEHDHYNPDTDDYEQWEGDFGHLFEVVLVDKQMKVWGEELKKRGFQPIYRWFNDNSQNWCNKLVMNTRPDLVSECPYKW